MTVAPSATEFVRARPARARRGATRRSGICHVRIQGTVHISVLTPQFIDLTAGGQNLDFCSSRAQKSIKALGIR
jgi:hypothetical protein